MRRDEAIELLARYDVGRLDLEQRQSLLADWWTGDADDPDYAALPDSLLAAFVASPPSDDPQNPLYDSLLQLALQRSFKGVVNSYLEMRLANLGYSAKVEGDVEALRECPCCGFL